MVSIFTPVLNEEENVLQVYEAVKKVMATIKNEVSYEHVFSDNASTDKTLSILRDLADRDSRVKIIALAKNFGPTKSTLNGLLRCTGDAIIQIDADLQDPPLMIVEFIQKWISGYQVVYGIRTDRQENLLLKSFRKLFYRIANVLSNEELIPDVGDFRLIDKRILCELGKVKDYNPYLRGIIANLGFRQVGIPYVRNPRQRGQSKLTLLRLIDFGLNGIVSHSTILLRLSTITGVLICLGNAIYISIVVLATLFGGSPPSGIPSLIVIILFISGIQLITLGILGEYIGKIFLQSIQRPLVVEKELIGFNNEPS